MSNALEDRLVSTLLSKYQISGENAQKLLDNPLFNQLPLDQKLVYLKKYRDHLAAPLRVTSKTMSPIITGAVMGGIGGAATLFINNKMMGGKAFPPSYLAAAAGLGAVLGTVAPGMTVLKNFQRDKTTQQDISNNRYLSALIDRSVSTPSKPKDINWNVYTDMISAPTHKFLSDVNEYDPNANKTPTLSMDALDIPIHPDALKHL